MLFSYVCLQLLFVIIIQIPSSLVNEIQFYIHKYLNYELYSKLVIIEFTNKNLSALMKLA